MKRSIEANGPHVQSATACFLEATLCAATSDKTTKSRNNPTSSAPRKPVDRVGGRKCAVAADFHARTAN
ncbi:hypothetical protein N8T08_009888 [Aspergillus melleus]|uniref:Uncharacterized protein n=1 Tax=Aspergillus melleus TaxID=138277 RepID=A0ACC3AT63_9EURO|nr:hypothetical protein N8T08_009888 [Aspergillus melleus]